MSNITSEVLKTASYTNNNRCVHAHFDNVFFDGIDLLTFRIDGNEIKKKIADKTHFAKALGVEDVMNFPVDKRSPVVSIVELEQREGDKTSTWQFNADFFGQFKKKFIFAISP